MYEKPTRIFDRRREWHALVSFVRDTHPGAPCWAWSAGGGDRGKSFLLQALCEATGGLYFGATEATEAESLRLFADALTAHTGAPSSIRFATGTMPWQRCFG